MSSPEYFDTTGKPVSAPTEIRVGTSAAIFNESGQVLLERRSDNGWWGVPGGAVDIGESVEQAIVREVFEETGLHVRVKRLVGVYSDPMNHTIARYPDGSVVHNVTSFFECERLSGQIRMSAESTDLRYFSVDALPEDFLPGHRVRIQDALADRAKAFVR